MSAEPSKENPVAPSQVTSTESAKDKPQKQAKAAKKNKAGGTSALEFSPAPEYLAHRIKIFEELKSKADLEVTSKERLPITITLADGKTKGGISWETSPMDIAKGISKSLSERVVIAKVK